MTKRMLYGFVFFMLNILLMPACNAQPADHTATEASTIPAVAIQQLGDSLCHLLFTADTVNVYTLKGKEQPDSTDIVVSADGYVRDTLSCMMPVDSLNVLRLALLNDSNSYYRDTTYSVRSPYMPVLELEFTQNTNRASILISLTDKTWSVIRQGRMLFNCTYADPQVLERITLYYIERLRKNSNMQRHE